MVKRTLYTLLLAIAIPLFINAQDLTDALRFSGFQMQGTARAGSMGNAFGALGGDFTSVSINPAGLGIYRSSEFVFSPTFGQTQIEAKYHGNPMTDSKYNFLLENLSYVASLQPKKQSETGLVRINVGIGFNKLKDFNNVANILGHNIYSSFLDNLIENANGEDPSQGWSEFYEGLAYFNPDTETGTDLIYEEDGFWRSDIQKNPFDENVQNYEHSQKKSISRQGGINEYTIAAGFNFNHKLYFGVSVGIVDVTYKESSSFNEWDQKNIIPRFNEMQFDRYLGVNGTGYNGKIGVIFKPINEIRLGASIHTPTFYNLHETFDTRMISNNTFEEIGQVEDIASSRINDYDYDLETPLRATLSAAYIFSDKGLISVDYEYVNIGTAKLRRGGDGYNFVNENSDIAEIYKPAGNFRIGGEYVVAPDINLRAGYELYPSVYKTTAFGTQQPNSDSHLNVVSAGFGYRTGGFFFDLAYRHSFSKSFDMLYQAPSSGYYPVPEMASFKEVNNKVMFTLGFKF